MVIPPSLTSALAQHVARVIGSEGGWIGFERFMALALYTPGLGYYARADHQFGHMPGPAGSDFVTAPEMTPYFGRALAAQVAQALQISGTRAIWEFGAGSGALAEQLLQTLGNTVERYTIVDVSAALRERQQQRLAAFGAQVQWVATLPAQMRGVVLGNEVLDAMPVCLLHRAAGVWHERGVARGQGLELVWQDRPSPLRPPSDVEGEHDYLTEIHPQAEGFVRMLSDRLEQGAAFLIDYGFPEREYYHPQRATGTLMCHRAHRMDSEPLADVGEKDITAHINFTGLALAAQEASAACAQGAGFNLLGYTSQARFLMNCGILSLLDGATLQERVMAQKLIMEHEMGELFKVIAFCRGEPWDAIGFAHGDRSHTL